MGADIEEAEIGSSVSARGAVAETPTTSSRPKRSKLSKLDDALITFLSKPRESEVAKKVCEADTEVIVLEA